MEIVGKVTETGEFRQAVLSTVGDRSSLEACEADLKRTRKELHGQEHLKYKLGMELDNLDIFAEDYDGEGVVVGIDPDGSTNQALDFAIAEAIATEQPLRLITGWGLPAWISKPAEAMGGGLGPVGEQYQARLDSLAAVLREEHEGLDVRGHAVEGSSPTRVLQGYAKTRGVLVLGTRSRAALGRALFGSVTHSTLLNLTIPTVIVPQD